MHTDGRACAWNLPCVVEASIPTIPPGLDSQSVIVAQYMKDLMCSMLEAMQTQIAHLERAVLVANSSKQPMQHVGMYDSEVASAAQAKCASEVLHQAAPRDSVDASIDRRLAWDGIVAGTSGETRAVAGRDTQLGYQKSVEKASKRKNMKALAFSATLSDTAKSFVESPKSGASFTTRLPRKSTTADSAALLWTTRHDIETHQVMKVKARIRACFTSDTKPLKLSAFKLSGVLQRRGMEGNYDLPLLESVLTAMNNSVYLIVADAQPKSSPSKSWVTRAIQNNRMASTLTVSKRQKASERPSVMRATSMNGIIDLDTFIKVLLSSESVGIVEAFTEDPEVVRCMKEIQHVLIEKETIHDIIDRLASGETHFFDNVNTSGNIDWTEHLNRVEYFIVIVSLFAYVLEVDDQQDWMGWGVIEVVCTSVLTLLIVWKVHTESFKAYMCGDRWKWNLTDTCCTAIAVGALLARFMAGGLYSIRLTIAIRLFRGFRMHAMLYLTPVLRETAIMLAGFVVGLPYLFCAVSLMMLLTLITGVATKVAVGPVVGQDNMSRCGTGDEYFRNGDRSDECLLVSLYSEEFLDSVAHSMMMTFRCITGSCTTKAGLSLDLVFSEYYGAGFVVAYILVTCSFLFGMANVITAVFIEGIRRDLETHFKYLALPSYEVHKKLKDLKDLVRELVQGGDNDIPLNLTRSELDNIMNDARVRSILYDLDVCFDNEVPPFELFDFDCDEYVRESDFYFMILKMRGSLRKADVVGTWLSLRDQREANHIVHLAILDAQQNLAKRLQCRNAAVMLYRVDKPFEDEIHPSCGELCIVSFPGRHVFEWQGLVQLCKKGQLNSACVYLPKDDPQQRYGKHTNNPATPGNCYCWSLYGGQQEWGCRWFSQWIKQVKLAVTFNMELVVVFFEGQKDCGILEWKDLASADLWDGLGLGGSQKGEVAWLKQQGYGFTSMDLPEAVQRFNLNSAIGRKPSTTSSLDEDQSSAGEIEILHDADWPKEDGGQVAVRRAAARAATS